MSRISDRSPISTSHRSGTVEAPAKTEEAQKASSTAAAHTVADPQSAATSSDHYTQSPSSQANARSDSGLAKPRLQDRSELRRRTQQRPAEAQSQTSPASGSQPAAEAQARTKDLDGNNRVTQGPTSLRTINWSQNPQLPQATRDALVAEAARNPQVQGQLQQISQHPLYARLNEPQRAQLLTVYQNSDAGGRAELPTLMGRQVAVGSGNPRATTPALLSEDNGQPRHSLLDNLHTLSTQPLDAAVAGRRGELLGSAVRETGQPSWHLDQGAVGTCAPTSISTHLNQHTPAEYVRLLGGLASPGRSVPMANGSRLDAARNDTANPPTVPDPTGLPGATISDTRSLSERMFQSALQQRGDRMSNPSATFDANTDQTGLSRDEAAHVMTGLYNRPYAATTVTPPAGQAEAPGTAMAQRGAALGQIERELRSGQGPVYAAMLWGSAPPTGQPWGGHALMVTQMDAERVYFRNPWGSRAAQGEDYRDGRNLAGPPPRRVEDSQGGLESMTRAEFQSRLRGLVAGPPVGG